MSETILTMTMMNRNRKSSSSNNMPDSKTTTTTTSPAAAAGTAAAGMFSTTSTTSVVENDIMLDVVDNYKISVDQLIKNAAVEVVEESKLSSVVQDEKEMDAYLADELNQMSLMERQRVFEEIHGVDEIIDEENVNPQFIEDKLLELDHEICIMNDKLKNAYNMAESISKEYVQNESFRLTFLRADMFDPKKAAKRFITYFECRLALFGVELLTRPITLTDLNDDDIQCLKSGYFQILNQRDTTNRAVLVNIQGMFPRSYKLALNMQRMYHYMHCTMAEDMLTQIHGYVFICYQIGSFSYDPPPDLFNGNSNLMMQGCPVRMCGMHMCLDHPIMKAISRVVLAASGSSARARCRIHDNTSNNNGGDGGGSHTEIHYKLLSFGIPVDLFPITNDGKLKKTAHQKWLTMRHIKEELINSSSNNNNNNKTNNTNFQQQFASSSSSSNNNNNSNNILRIDLPGRDDVLMGKGKPLQESSGNVALRALVNMYVPDYESCQKYTKFVYVDKVIDDINKKGGRFLKRDKTGHLWIMAEDDEIKEKISKTFTSEQAKAKKRKKKKNIIDVGNKKQQQQQQQQQQQLHRSNIPPATTTSSSSSNSNSNTKSSSSSLWSPTATVQKQHQRAVVVNKYHATASSSSSSSIGTSTVAMTTMTTTNTTDYLSDYLSDSSGGKRSRAAVYDSNSDNDNDDSSFWNGCFGVFGGIGGGEPMPYNYSMISSSSKRRK